MAEKQRTLKAPISFKGKGLHTGVEVNMTFLPAPDSHGYIFKRIDLPGQPLINALAENVVETTRGTVLEENGARVSTIEHVLASFVGMGIDNVLVEVDGPEAPILDGSARDFAEAIDKIGAVDQATNRKYFILKEKVEYYDEESGIHIIAYPDKIQSINVLIDYNSIVLGNQYASLDELVNFKEEIAPCRTFVFLHELEYLAKNNLIKGGDVDNAIVIVDKKWEQKELDRLADLFNKPRDMKKPLNRGIALFTVSLGLVIPLFGGRPVLTMIISQVFAAIATPVIVLLMLMMQRRGDIMAEHKTSAGMNFVIGFIFLFTVLMAITGIIGIEGLL